MARTGDTTDRRAKADQIRQQQKSADRRKSFLIIGVCALVGVLLLSGALFSVLRSEEESKTPLGDLGASASSAGCREPVTQDADGAGDHVAPGTDIDYPDSPPAFGTHYAAPQPMTRKFYTADDRPDVGTLVHNLEHGFTVLWYDETIAEDKAQLAAVRAITDKYPATSGLEDKFMAAPWTSGDGDGFPDGAHVALTHWTSGGTNGNPDKPTGVWQYCNGVSGQAVKGFVADYPFTDAPEGNVPG